MLVNKSNFDLLPGGGNGKKVVVYSGGAIGRSNFGPKHGIENRGGAVGGVENRMGNDFIGGHEV